MRQLPVEDKRKIQEQIDVFKVNLFSVLLVMGLVLCIHLENSEIFWAFVFLGTLFLPRNFNIPLGLVRLLLR